MAAQVNGLPAYSTPALPPDQPVETGRYLDALRRSKLLIVLIVVPLTAAVLLVSLMLPKTYRATSKVVVEGVSDPLQNRDVETIERRLATIDALITTRETLRRAARRVPGETVATLDESVSSSVDPAANIINISATHETPRGAARIANAVATTFVNTERRTERRRLDRARATLNQDLAALEGRRGEQAAAERADIRAQLRDLNLHRRRDGHRSWRSPKRRGHRPRRTRRVHSEMRPSDSSPRSSSRPSSCWRVPSSSRGSAERGS